MLDELHEAYDEMNTKMSERMEEATNGHDKLMLVNEMLEGMLQHVQAAMPKEEFRNIDNTPKHLLHMTEEDLIPKSPAVLRDELTELIKEAKSKIKPVMMDPSLRDCLLMTDEEAKANKDLINTDGRQHALLIAENISLEVLRKIQDKKLEIDLEYE
tara:strand:- start:205 stop:675 length:471 start_codon:yes stop_codon:yes gene_type:complete